MFKVELQKARFPNLSLLSNQYEKNDDEIEHDYNPFRLITLQHYNPLYSLFFDVTTETQNRITLSSKYYFHDLHHVTDAKGKLFAKPVFIKFSPLLDPIRYLIGKYDTDEPIVLPYVTADNHSKPTRNGKLNDTNNSSFVDCFFNYLNSQLKNKHGFINGLDFYGSFLCIQEKYKFNITDDLEYLVTSKFFINSFDNKYTIEKFSKGELVHLCNENLGVLPKQKLQIMDSYAGNDNDADINDIIDIQTISFDDSATPTSVSSKIGNDGGNETILLNSFGGDNNSDDDDDADSDDSSLNYTADDEENVKGVFSDTDSDNDFNEDADGDDDDDEDDDADDNEDDDADDNEEDDEPTFHAYIKNFPIQMICLEKCDGTLDELFQHGQIDKKTGSAALFQIVMILLIYQSTFNMTHNDLHTNNIMYSETEDKYIYYYYNGEYYKVPTFGRIYKIIDFGRAIYTFNGHTFCSDSFAPKGDAHTQYNCEPYYNPNKQLVLPNPSFDLCRLGASIYDFVINDDDERNPKKMDIFQKTIYRWCHDDNGKNVLYKSDGSERYPNFALYKMLSRTVNKWIPKVEIKTQPIFIQYKLKQKPQNTQNVLFLNVDRIPTYV
jgi:hypothetical protein